MTSQQTDPATDRPTRVRWVVAVLLSAATVIAYLDRVVISNVVKELQSEIGISDREAWVLASFVLGYSMMQIPMGRLGDRVGLRFILPGIVVMWSLLTGLTTVVDSLLALCLARRRERARGCRVRGPEYRRVCGCGDLPTTGTGGGADEWLGGGVAGVRRDLLFDRGQLVVGRCPTTDWKNRWLRIRDLVAGPKIVIRYNGPPGQPDPEMARGGAAR
ncbi:MAG: MFS transporter [Planctomycetales bacterium]|nr:MFS transporter [Planctomycetales bacterium]